MYKKNRKVKGEISFYVNDELHSTVKYETSYQRDIATDKFLKSVKNIRNKLLIYYVINVDEKSIEPKQQTKNNYLLPDIDILPKRLNRVQTQPRLIRYTSQQ